MKKTKTEDDFQYTNRPEDEGSAAPEWSETPLRKKSLSIINRDGARERVNFEGAIKERQDIHQEIARLEEVKKTISNQLLELVTEAELTTVRAAGHSVTLVSKQGNLTLDQGLLKKELAEAGVAVKTIQTLWEKCTKRGAPSTVFTVR